MKVVKKETPKEEVKFENVFGEEYAPEEFEFICDDCLAEEVDDLKENVTWLAEDILDLTDILDCIHSANKMMLDIIIKQDEQIKVLDDKIRSVDNAWLYLFWFLVIWNIVLSVLFALSIYDVL